MSYDDILEKIFDLSKYEGKTLEQRALKLSEETGEVAEAVLSCMGAPTCSYKGLNNNDILQEAIDVIIVAFSCIEQLNVTDKDIKNMFDAKLGKWKKKINNEKNIKE